MDPGWNIRACDTYVPLDLQTYRGTATDLNGNGPFQIDSVCVKVGVVVEVRGDGRAECTQANGLSDLFRDVRGALQRIDEDRNVALWNQGRIAWIERTAAELHAIADHGIDGRIDRERGIQVDGRGNSNRNLIRRIGWQEADRKVSGGRTRRSRLSGIRSPGHVDGV